MIVLIGLVCPHHSVWFILPKNAQDCPRTPKIAQDCPRTPKIAQECPILPKIAQELPRLPKNAQDCQMALGKDSENLKSLDIGLKEVGAKRRLNVVNK